MMKILSLMVLLLFVPVTSQAETGPDQLVRENTQRILGLLKKNKKVYEKDHEKLFKMVNEVILPHTDFVVMSKWILGRTVWNKASEDQRQRFVKEFQNLMVRTYAVALLKYTNEKVIFYPFTAKEGSRRATVKTEVKQSGGGDNVPVIYSFYYKKGNGWKIIDVKIAGISMVTNYRIEYDVRIKRIGLDGLIKSMASGKGAAIMSKNIAKKINKK
jgi:phospholipid transport system substrate-binding protein